MFNSRTEFRRPDTPTVGILERRERERAIVRTAIVEAARDLLSEHGPEGLSMRAIAERIEYSPATIYLYFRDKDELVSEVVRQAFVKLGGYMRREVEVLGETADALEQYGATGRGYARFALENTAWFRVMFELPKAPCAAEGPEEGPTGLNIVTEIVRRAADTGVIESADARRTAVLGWGLVHGLTWLYLMGRLGEDVSTDEEFLGLVDEAIRTMGSGFERSAVRHTGTFNRNRNGNGESRVMEG